MTDPVYRFINTGKAANQSIRQTYADYSLMTAEEKAAYNAIYAEKGSKEARDYLKRIESDIDARKTAQTQEKMTEFAYSAPVAASVASVGTSLASGAGLADIFLQNA